MKSIALIVCLLLLGCGDTKISFYEVDFYGNNIKVPEFLQHNESEESLKHYCDSNIYLKDSTERTFLKHDYVDIGV